MLATSLGARAACAAQSHRVRAVEEVWELIGDVYHLPRWCRGVERVEECGTARFTEVMRTS